MKILYVVNYLGGGGAASAILFLIKNLPYENHYIFVRKETRKILPGIEIRNGNANDLVHYFRANQFDLIHWFRTDSSQFFDDYCLTGQKLPVLLTHCQVPTGYILRLNLNELKYADYLVFICKQGFNHPYHDFIREKSMVYFCTQADDVAPKEDYSIGDVLNIGRGSALSKCPAELIQPFTDLSDIPFTFKVAGGGSSKFRASYDRLMGKYCIVDRVQFLGNLSKNDWFSFLSHLDIYVYTLPKNAYSAIDYTLQHAMLTGLPIVYSGPKAPAELIIHGETGFIAKNPKEITYYIRLLYEDAELRERMGQAARKHLLKNFPYTLTLEGYSSAYNRCLQNIDLDGNRSIPRLYKVKYKIHYTLHMLYASYHFVLHHGFKEFFRRLFKKFSGRRAS